MSDKNLRDKGTEMKERKGSRKVSVPGRPTKHRESRREHARKESQFYIDSFKRNKRLSSAWANNISTDDQENVMELYKQALLDDHKTKLSETYPKEYSKIYTYELEFDDDDYLVKEETPAPSPTTAKKKPPAQKAKAGPSKSSSKPTTPDQIINPVPDDSETFHKPDDQTSLSAAIQEEIMEAPNSVDENQRLTHQEDSREVVTEAVEANSGETDAAIHRDSNDTDSNLTYREASEMEMDSHYIDTKSADTSLVYHPPDHSKLYGKLSCKYCERDLSRTFVDSDPYVTVPNEYYTMYGDRYSDDSVFQDPLVSQEYFPASESTLYYEPNDTDRFYTKPFPSTYYKLVQSSPGGRHDAAYKKIRFYVENGSDDAVIPNDDDNLLRGCGRVKRGDIFKAHKENVLPTSDELHCFCDVCELQYSGESSKIPAGEEKMLHVNHDFQNLTSYNISQRPEEQGGLLSGYFPVVSGTSKSVLPSVDVHMHEIASTLRNQSEPFIKSYKSTYYQQPDETYKSTYAQHPNEAYNSTYDQHPDETYKSTYDEHPDETYKSTYDEHPDKTYKSTYDQHPDETYKSKYDQHPDETYKSKYDQHPDETYKSTYYQHPDETYKSAYGLCSDETYTATYDQHPDEAYKSTYGQCPDETYKTTYDQHPDETYKSPYGQCPDETFKSTYNQRPDEMNISTYDHRPDETFTAAQTMHKEYTSEHYRESDRVNMSVYETYMSEYDQYPNKAHKSFHELSPHKVYKSKYDPTQDKRHCSFCEQIPHKVYTSGCNQYPGEICTSEYDQIPDNMYTPDYDKYPDKIYIREFDQIPDERFTNGYDQVSPETYEHRFKQTSDKSYLNRYDLNADKSYAFEYDRIPDQTHSYKNDQIIGKTSTPGHDQVPEKIFTHGYDLIPEKTYIQEYDQSPDKMCTRGFDQSPDKMYTAGYDLYHDMIASDIHNIPSEGNNKRPVYSREEKITRSSRVCKVLDNKCEVWDVDGCRTWRYGQPDRSTSSGDSQASSRKLKKHKSTKPEEKPVKIFKFVVDAREKKVTCCLSKAAKKKQKSGSKHWRDIMFDSDESFLKQEDMCEALDFP